MSARRMEVTIERLVLEGVPADSHAKFVDLFTRHLEQALAQRARSREAPAAENPSRPIVPAAHSSRSLPALAFQAAQAVTSKVPR